MLVITFVVVAGALAYFMLTPNMGSSPSISEGYSILYIHVVDDSSKAPLGGVFVNAGPLNSTKDVDIALRNFVCCGPGFPGMPPLYGCSYEVPNRGIVKEDEGKRTVLKNGSKVALPPCPEKRYETNSTGWITIFPEDARYYLLFIQYRSYANSYHDTVQICQKQATYVTVRIPSGKFTTVCGN